MNIDDEVGRILAQTDILVPHSLAKVLAAVGLPHYMLYAKRGWHPERGAMAGCGSEETLFRGALHAFLVAKGVDAKRCHV